MISFWMLFVMTALSTWQIGESFRHGSIFESVRARIESRGDAWAEWVQCGFCFSHAAAALAVFLAGGHVAVTRYGMAFNPFTAVLLWLSAIRTANVLNDVLKPYCRTPTSVTLPELPRE